MSYIPPLASLPKDIEPLISGVADIETSIDGIAEEKSGTETLMSGIAAGISTEPDAAP